MTLALHVLLQAAFLLRVLLRPHRDPASRMAWIVVILAVPVLGMVGYVLLGETNVGRRRVARLRAVQQALPRPEAAPGFAAALDPPLPGRARPLFRVGQSISGYAPVGGNEVALLPDSRAAIEALVADIEAARQHVHLLFYIWLPDGSGTAVARALARAAARGVACRALVDDLGSRLLIRSPLWTEMAAAGVRLGRALPVGNPLLRALGGRVDLRNHRKLAVLDDRIAWCGSQNCADAEFRVKARYAPWVDVMFRVEGPFARQGQHLFATDWTTETGEDLAALLTAPLPAPRPGGLPAQLVASGPTIRHSAMSEMFQALLHAARERVTITTPYYVPDEAMQAALCAAAWRGVATTLVLPARNDSRAVAWASRSHYGDLLEAGVRVHEYAGGLLHAKTLTLDGEAALVGSANMDRRSFDLNYENNLLLWDRAATAAIEARQAAFLAAARPVTAAEVAAWPRRRRLLHNAAAILSPVL